MITEEILFIGLLAFSAYILGRMQSEGVSYMQEVGPDNFYQPGVGGSIVSPWAYYR